MRRFHLITYPVAARDKTRPPKQHQRRDLCAGLELSFALMALGFQPGEQIFNQPPRGTWTGAEPASGPFAVPLPFVRRRDLLLHFTRPPFSDVRSGMMRKIALAQTDLERRLFAAWRSFLALCARDHVQVHASLFEGFRPGFKHCREMSFQQKGWGAPFHEVNDQEGGGWRRYAKQRKTALFFLRLQEAWEGGRGYVCAFGMDGCTTLVWAYRLARDFKHLLERPGFVIAELELGEMPDHATDLSFCRTWPISLALVHDLAPEPVLV
jgi:hypothetical protein